MYCHGSTDTKSHNHTGSHPIVQHILHDEGGLHGHDPLPQLVVVGGRAVVQVLGVITHEIVQTGSQLCLMEYSSETTAWDES